LEPRPLVSQFQFDPEQFFEKDLTVTRIDFCQKDFDLRVLAILPAMLESSTPSVNMPGSEDRGFKTASHT